MKKSIFLFVFGAITILASCQDRQTFNEPIRANAGIYFLDGTFLNTALSVSGNADWNTMANKPTVFPPATHEHPTLYRAINWNPTWTGIESKPTQFAPLPHTHSWLTEITDKPLTELELIDELPKMKLIPPHQYTTAEINALPVGPNDCGMVFDKTTKALKLWTGTEWLTFIMNK